MINHIREEKKMNNQEIENKTKKQDDNWQQRLETENKSN